MDKEIYKSQVLRIKRLGEEIGYGNVMDICSALWAADLNNNNRHDNGAFYPALLIHIKDEIKEIYIDERDNKITLLEKLDIW